MRIFEGFLGEEASNSGVDDDDNFQRFQKLYIGCIGYLGYAVPRPSALQ